MASVALRSGQRVTDLLAVMGLPAEWPEVFDAMVDLLSEAAPVSGSTGEVDWDAKFAELTRR